MVTVLAVSDVDEDDDEDEFPGCGKSFSDLSHLRRHFKAFHSPEAQQKAQLRAQKQAAQEAAWQAAREQAAQYAQQKAQQKVQLALQAQQAQQKAKLQTGGEQAQAQAQAQEQARWAQMEQAVAQAAAQAQAQTQAQAQAQRAQMEQAAAQAAQAAAQAAHARAREQQAEAARKFGSTMSELQVRRDRHLHGTSARFTCDGGRFVLLQAWRTAAIELSFPPSVLAGWKEAANAVRLKTEHATAKKAWAEQEQAKLQERLRTGWRTELNGWGSMAGLRVRLAEVEKWVAQWVTELQGCLHEAKALYDWWKLEQEKQAQAIKQRRELAQAEAEREAASSSVKEEEDEPYELT